MCVRVCCVLSNHDKTLFCFVATNGYLLMVMPGLVMVMASSNSSNSFYFNIADILCSCCLLLNLGCCPESDQAKGAQS